MNTYHIYNEGNLVLFRDRADKIFFNNKFAAASYNHSVDVLCLTEVSTHFHSLVEADNEVQLKEWIQCIKRAYGHYYGNKYGCRIGDRFRIEYSIVIGKEKIREKLIYVMANPVHHYITDSPFKEQFSNASYIFPSEYMPINFINAIAASVVRFDELSARRQKELLNNDKVPGHYLVDSEGFILPSSFINVKKVRTHFNGSYKYFRYLIDTSVKGTDGKPIEATKLAVLCDGLDDEVVCGEIDAFARKLGRKSFHFLSEPEKDTLLEILRLKGVPREQCRRCLWLSEEKQSH